MNKKSFWQRTNRGFVISMVILAVVVVYVIATQLVLSGEKKQLRKLSDDVLSIVIENSVLTDEQLAALVHDDNVINTDVMKNMNKKIKEKLSPLFVKDAEYLDTGVSSVYNTSIGGQTTGDHRIYDLKKNKLKVNGCQIDDDVASIAISYTNTETSDRIKSHAVANPKPERVENGEQFMDITLSCKKVDGEWKIFRISEINCWYSYKG